MRIENAKIRMPENKAIDKKEKSTRVSAYTEDFRGEYYKLPIDKILPFKNQARKDFDEKGLEELARTIQSHGIRQPLTVLPSNDKEGFYEVVSGERRLRAAKIAGLTQVPCIIIHDELKAEEIAIIENIQRKDLHPVELAIAYNNLLTNKICKSTQEIADKLCIQKSSVVETLAILKLDQDIQDLLINNKIKSRALVRELNKAISKNAQIQLINNFVKKENLEDNYSPQSDKAKNKSLITKQQVLSISLNGDQFIVEKNKLKNLDSELKQQLIEIIRNLI